MAAINWLADKLRAAHPQLRFETSDDFRWSPSNQTVYYDAASDDAASLLHETAHGLLDHKSFDRDVDLLKMERQAWAHAIAHLAEPNQVDIDQDEVEAALDTYRDWLHQRSLCPACQQTGLQIKDGNYRCLNCHQTWRANDARRCALRRIKQ